MFYIYILKYNYNNHPEMGMFLNVLFVPISRPAPSPVIIFQLSTNAEPCRYALAQTLNIEVLPGYNTEPDSESDIGYISEQDKSNPENIE